MCNKKGFIVEVTIKIDDSYRELSKITKISDNVLRNHIMRVLTWNKVLGDHEQELSFTIKEVMNCYGEFSVSDLAKLMFGELGQKLEVIEFLGSLTFWGDGTNIECDQCGCEMTEADSDEWSKFKCENGACDNTYGERYIYNQFNNKLI